MKDKILRWLIYGVLLALVPLASGWVFRIISGQNISLEDLLANGELLLITAALCASGVGELIGSGDKYKTAKIISGGFSIIILLFSALTFSAVSNPTILNVTLDKIIIKNTSIIIYICAFLSSGACAYLSE